MTPAITLDRACADAEPEARAAAEAEAGGPVGTHEGVDADGERLATHYFSCLNPAYRGWRWAVTVARASRAKVVTVDEVVLLPGPEALLAPTWVPWHERLRPGDLGVGDLLPTSADDPRLAPAFLDAPVDDDEPADAAFELGLGRIRVLSVVGRDEAADRWYRGAAGPDVPIARAAPLHCATCGFFIALSGTLSRAFGVCANEFAPDDGRVVAVDHGCGAHSEVMVMPSLGVPPPPLVDEFGYEPSVVEPDDTGSVADADSAEPFGHS